MSVGQIFMYHNLGIELKYGKPKEDDAPESLASMTREEVEKWRAEMAATYGDTNG